MNLQHLIMTESKEVLKKKIIGACHKDTGCSLTDLPLAKPGTI